MPELQIPERVDKGPYRAFVVEGRCWFAWGHPRERQRANAISHAKVWVAAIDKAHAIHVARASTVIPDYVPLNALPNHDGSYGRYSEAGLLTKVRVSIFAPSEMTPEERQAAKARQEFRAARRIARNKKARVRYWAKKAAP